MKWLQNYIPNWGWAIVVLTLVINMLLFPLRISSYETTLKMQRVGPEIKQIQDKYKKYSMRDPRKAEMNKEVMAVYSREGINPVGGCFQMFLQMPIWFGLNSMLRSAIEMRHAPMVRVDHGSFGEGSLLCVADHDGVVDVSGVEDDADDVDRSATADDDEGDADHDGGNFYDLANFERVGSVYFDEQHGGHFAAMVVEQAASSDGGGAGRRRRQE